MKLTLESARLRLRGPSCTYRVSCASSHMELAAAAWIAIRLCYSIHVVDVFPSTGVIVSRDVNRHLGTLDTIATGQRRASLCRVHEANCK